MELSRECAKGAEPARNIQKRMAKELDRLLEKRPSKSLMRVSSKNFLQQECQLEKLRQAAESKNRGKKPWLMRISRKRKAKKSLANCHKDSMQLRRRLSFADEMGKPLAKIEELEEWHYAKKTLSAAQTFKFNLCRCLPSLW